MILGIYGTSGTGCEVYEIALQLNENNCRWNDIVFIDDTKDEGTFRNRNMYPFVRLPEFYNCGEIEIIIALGEPHYRRLLNEKVKEAGHNLATIIHPDAQISISAEIAEGLVARKGAIVSCDAKVGRNVFLQNYATVGHGAVVGNNCQLSSFCGIAGNCVVGDNVFIGLNVMMKERTKIGSYCIIGMGSCVFKDVPDEMIVMGNPARIVKKNESKMVFE